VGKKVSDSVPTWYELLRASVPTGYRAAQYRVGQSGSVWSHYHEIIVLNGQ